MLGTLISAVISGEAADAAGRARRAAIVYLLAALLSLAGLGFLIAAGFMATAHAIGHIPAALAFGGGALLIAIVIVIAHRIRAGRERQRAAERRRTELKSVLGVSAVAMLPTLLSRGGLRTLAIPAIAAAAYAIYRENARPRPPSEPDEH